MLDQTISRKNNPNLFYGKFRLNYYYGYNLAKQMIYPHIRFCDKNCIENLWETIHELTMNSIEHGNKCKRDSNLLIKIATGNKGSIFRIEDSGEGFDYVSLSKNYLKDKSNLPSKLKFRGNGFKRLDLQGKMTIFYEGKGNIANALLEFKRIY